MQLYSFSRSSSYGLGLLALSAALLVGCSHKPVTENVPPPRIDQLDPRLHMGDAPENMLDWNGTYQAVLPCTGCSGIAISVQLRKDKTAVVRERRLGGNLDNAVAPTYTGPFHFDPPGGSMVTLSKSANEAPAYRFFVSEGWIEMRERATGAPLSPGNIYRLNKTSLPES